MDIAGPSDREKLEEDISRIQKILCATDNESENETSESDEVEEHIQIPSNELLDLGNVSEDTEGEQNTSAYYGDSYATLLSQVSSNEDIRNTFFRGKECDFNQLPASLDTCLVFNEAYQDMIRVAISHITLMLVNNRERQRELQHSLNESVKKSGKSTGRIRSIPLTVFLAPYFQDANGCLPPNNVDVIKRESLLLTDAYTHLPKIWTKYEFQELEKAVKSNIRMSAMEPLMIRKEFLCDKLATATMTPEEEEKAKEKLEQTEKEILEIKMTSDRILEARVSKLDWMMISASIEGHRTPEECEYMWKAFLHPSIRKSKWLKPEDERLKTIAAKYNFHDWDSIAAELKTNRTALQCLERYQSELNPNLVKGPFSEQEDQLIKQVVEACRIGDYIPWHQVTYYLEGRTRLQISSRYNRSLAPNVKKGPWHPKEDMILLSAVEKFGTDWKRIQAYLPGRTNYQCRERYKNCLANDIKSGKWSDKEDQILIEAIKENGPGKWAQLAKKIPGRTDNMILYRYRLLNKLRPNPFKQKKDDGATTAAESQTEDEITYNPVTKLNRYDEYRRNIRRAVQDRVLNLVALKQPDVEAEKASETIRAATLGELAARSKRLVKATKKRFRWRRAPKSLKKPRTRENIMINDELDALLTPLVACKRRSRSQSVVRSNKLIIQNAHMRLLMFEHLKAEDPVLKPKEVEKACTTSKDDFKKVIEQRILGKVDNQDIVVFPPSLASLNAFKLLLFYRKHLASLVSQSNSVDVLRLLIGADKSKPLSEMCSCRNRGRIPIQFPKTYEENGMSNPFKEDPDCLSKSCNGSDISLDSVNPETDLLKDKVRKRKKKPPPLDEEFEITRIKRKRVEPDDNPGPLEEQVPTNFIQEDNFCDVCRTVCFQNDFSLLQQRFLSMFLWPAILSANQPSQECLDATTVLLSDLSNERKKNRCNAFKRKKLKAKKPWVSEALHKFHGTLEKKKLLEESKKQQLEVKKKDAVIKPRRVRQISNIPVRRSVRQLLKEGKGKESDTEEL